MTSVAFGHFEHTTPVQFVKGRLKNFIFFGTLESGTVEFNFISLVFAICI